MRDMEAMYPFRCILCGSSRKDPECYRCARCNGPRAARSAPCLVSRETVRELFEHSSELSELGLQIREIPRHRATRYWDLHFPGHHDVVDVMVVVEIIRPGTIRQIVDCLFRLAIPEKEILALRLDEPEQILSYREMDKKQPGEAVNWKGVRNSVRAKPKSKKRISTKSKKPKRPPRRRSTKLSARSSKN